MNKAKDEKKEKDNVIPDLDEAAAENASADDVVTGSTLASNPYIEEGLNMTAKEIRDAFVDINDKIKNGTVRQKDDAKLRAIGYMFPFICKMTNRIAGSYLSNPHDRDDAIHSAIHGFLEGLNVGYDQTKGATTTFFYPYVKHRLVEYLRVEGPATASGTKVTRYYYANMIKVQKAISQIESAGKLNPSAVDIAAFTGLPMVTVQRVLELTRSGVKYDLEDTEKYSGHNESADVEKQVIEKEQTTQLYTIMNNSLDEVSRNLLFLLFGLYDGREWSQKDASAKLGITITDSRARTQAALRILKNSPLKDLYPELYKEVSYENNKEDVSFIDTEGINEAQTELLNF